MFVVLFCAPMLCAAQSTGSQSRFGIGGQVGDPTGLALKYYIRTDWSAVTLVSWNLERFLLFSTHMTFERPIPDSPLHFFIGPGFFIFRSNSNRDARARFGISALPGLNFFAGHFEVFLQSNPGVRLAPDVRFTIGGAVGLRYYF